MVEAPLKARTAGAARAILARASPRKRERCATVCCSNAGGKETSVGEADPPDTGAKPGNKQGFGNPKNQIRGTGRPPGSANVMTRDLKQAILSAAARVGFDAHGKDAESPFLPRS
jgi:hypothetical protein